MIGADDIILIGLAAFIGWKFTPTTTPPTQTPTDGNGLEEVPDPDEYQWRSEPVVGSNSDGVEFAVEGLWVLKADGTEVEPQSDRSLWRAVQSSGGVVTPFSGMNSFGGLDGSGWGVPYAEALAAAESRLSSSEGTGELTPTPTPDSPPLEPLTPDFGAGSFEGFDLGGGVL